MNCNCRTGKLVEDFGNAVVILCEHGNFVYVSEKVSSKIITLDDLYNLRTYGTMDKSAIDQAWHDDPANQY